VGHHHTEGQSRSQAAQNAKRIVLMGQKASPTELICDYDGFCLCLILLALAASSVGSTIIKQATENSQQNQ
jgi:hypothetical protein